MAEPSAVIDWSRAYSPEPRVSIVVFLNQEHGDAGAVSDYILKRVMDIPESKHEIVIPSPEWPGTYLDTDTGLAITITQGGEGEVLINYHGEPEKSRVTETYKALSDSMVAKLKGDSLQVDIPQDNRTCHAQRVGSWKPASGSCELEGDYHCAEIDSVFHCSGSGNMLYGMFDGFLGKGPVNLMRPLGDDLWALACPRGMDAPPPGDWTLIVRRNDGGKVTGFTIGCWLARKLEFINQ
jgi:hypothetical protein